MLEKENPREVAQVVRRTVDIVGTQGKQVKWPLDPCRQAGLASYARLMQRVFFLRTLSFRLLFSRCCVSTSYDSCECRHTQTESQACTIPDIIVNGADQPVFFLTLCSQVTLSRINTCTCRMAELFWLVINK